MYARKLGECLLRLGDGEDDHKAAGADLHRWIVELTSLGACIMYGNPHLLKAIQSDSLDHTQAPVQELSDTFYADVLVRTLSNSLSLHYVLLKCLCMSCAAETAQLCFVCWPAHHSCTRCMMRLLHSL